MPDGLTPEERRAYTEGMRQATTDARLGNHESRLNAINGNIARNTTFIERQNDKLNSQNDKIDRIIAQLERNEALDKQRVEQMREANEKQISTRQFWLGVAAIVFVLISTAMGAVLGGVIH